MPRLLIDVETHDVKQLSRRLKRLKSTKEIISTAPYHEDTSYSQLILDSDKTEDVMDDWLYKYSNADYVGVVDITDEELTTEADLACLTDLRSMK